MREKRHKISLSGKRGNFFVTPKDIKRIRQYYDQLLPINLTIKHINIP